MFLAMPPRHVDLEPRHGTTVVVSCPAPTRVDHFFLVFHVRMLGDDRHGSLQSRGLLGLVELGRRAAVRNRVLGSDDFLGDLTV